MLFTEDAQDHQFLKEWTKLLIVNTPGILTTAAIYYPFTPHNGNFKTEKRKLVNLLQNNRHKYISRTVLPEHGITAECSHSGLSMEVWNEEGVRDEQGFVSASTNAKIKSAIQGQKRIHEDYKDDIGEQFCLTYQLDDLGHISGEDSSLAIVHIDGNGVGKYFEDLDSLPETRELSKYVEGAVKEAFEHLLIHIREHYYKIMDALGFDDKQYKYPCGYFTLTQKSLTTLKQTGLSSEMLHKLEGYQRKRAASRRVLATRDEFIDNLKETFGLQKKDILPHQEEILECAEKKPILPIRPIILGGDDITFVCPGKLGIYFSKLFIESFEKPNQPKTAIVEQTGISLTACAGIALINKKYPFSRGYRLAEGLCKNAKKVRKKNDDSCSYLDFHIVTGGISGTLEDIRKKQYQGPQGDLLFRPYKILPEQSDDEHSFERLVKRTAQLKKLPNNKIHELRQVLSLSEEAAERFVQKLAYREQQLPEIQGRGEKASLFQSIQEETKTPYFDMIEFMEIYPKFEFDKHGGNI